MSKRHEILDKWGSTSTVYLPPGCPPRICKAFKPDFIKSHFPVEQTAHERLATRPQPTSLPTCHGVHESIPAGTVLGLAKNGDLCRYLWKWNNEGRLHPDKALLYRWAGQATEALEFAHSLGLYNSDIHCLNFLLDGNPNLQVADWAAASVDGSRPRSIYRLRYSLFHADGTEVSRSIGLSAATEIYALGTAIYYMVTGHDPWPELREPEDGEEIKKRMCKQDFPDTSKLPVLGSVIMKC